MQVKQEFIKISDELFLQLGRLITDRYGIKMPPEKKIMFQARLQRRLRELNIYSFEEYAERLLHLQGESSEFSVLADYISTNKTEFFREKDHFSFLAHQVIPDFLSGKTVYPLPALKIWSAGCSSGQEAYSIAITLEECNRSNGGKLDYSILATDISTRMLKAAREAVYPMTQTAEIAFELKKRYFLKSKATHDPKVRLSKEIRDKVRPAYLNLMDELYPFESPFDVVFLRNTLIYFDQPVQQKVLSRVTDHLKPGGYLFIGHSESLINMVLPIKSVAPSVYRKINI